MGKAAKDHQCPGCTKSFKHSQNLHRHKQSCMKKVLLSCTSCTKVFSRKDPFNRHCSGCNARHCHRDNYCKLCNKYFLRPYNCR